MIKTILLFVLCCCSFGICNALTRYVTPAGAGNMSGMSWADALSGTSLQQAINASATGDEVWVAAGTYFTTNTSNQTISFSLKNDVAVYGSFAGNETAVNQRVFISGVTSILSGEIGSPAISDNSLHVISNTALNNSAVIDGFLIRGGNADGPSNSLDATGGGMLNFGGFFGECSPVIQHCVFADNNALYGGAIFNHGYNSGDASPVISHCVFTNNTANAGGGIDNYGYSGNASPQVINCLFVGNTATVAGGAMYCWGGGNGNASPVINNCTFAANNATTHGGALVADNANENSGFSGTSIITITNTIIWDNLAPAGAQFYVVGNGMVNATYSDIDSSGQTAPHILSGPLTGNSSNAPGFVNVNDPDGNDNSFMTADDGCGLQLSSPCFNTGDNTAAPVYDLKFSIRIANNQIDMGAYENITLTISADAATAESPICLFPNPNNGTFTLQLNTTSISEVLIYDALGQLVSSQKMQPHMQHQINLTDQGVYLITVITAEGQRAAARVVVRK